MVLTTRILLSFNTPKVKVECQDIERLSFALPPFFHTIMKDTNTSDKRVRRQWNFKFKSLRSLNKAQKKTILLWLILHEAIYTNYSSNYDDRKRRTEIIMEFSKELTFEVATIFNVDVT